MAATTSIVRVTGASGSQVATPLSTSVGGGITNVTNVSNPTVTTASNHGLVAGQYVTISGVVGATGVNGTFAVTTAPTGTTFTLTMAAPGAYTSGGTVAVPFRFTLDDSNTGTTPIQIPTATGTAYSREVVLGLGISASVGSTISNRQISLASAIGSGLYLFPKTANDASYVQGAAAPANGGSAGAVPTGYSAALTTTPTNYDTSSVAGAVTQNTAPATVNGAFQRILLGVDQTVVTTGTVALPNVVLTYQEQ
jgi:hypothetical protein